MTAQNAFRGGRRLQYRSLFWPVMLIGIGVIWLLINAGSLESAHLGVIFRLWPILLIAIGLDMILGRNSPALGALIGISTILLFVVLMFIGPSIGLISLPELQTQQVQYESTDAERYTVELHPGIENVFIQQGDDPNLLVDANLDYYGDLDTSDSGGSERTIIIQKVEMSDTLLQPSWLNGLGNDANWTIALNPDVPVTVAISGGIGNIDADLSDLDVRGVEADLGVGASVITLPAPEVPYLVSINSGIGEVTLDLPDEAPVRLEVEAGIGNIDAADWLIQVNDVAWESANYPDAEIAITVDVKGGIGNITIR